MNKQLTKEKKAEIFIRFEDGWSQKRLAEKYKINQSTVSRLIMNVKKMGSYGRLGKSGRKCVYSDSDIIWMKSKINKNPKVGSLKLSNDLRQERNVSGSPRTLRRTLNKIGLYARVACSKPLLRVSNIQSRFEFSKLHLWDSNQYWNRILWSDETKINLFGSDGRVYVRRPVGCRYDFKYLKPTIKHGNGSLMIWGCFSSEGVGKIEFIEGKMNALAYSKILNKNLLTSTEKLGIDSNFLFMQDNDPKHKSNLIKDFLVRKNINCLEWPSQSPDMNPIEHLWVFLKRKVKERLPKNIKNLKDIIIEEWYKIPKCYCKKLVSSMPRRIEGLYLGKGGHTRY